MKLLSVFLFNFGVDAISIEKGDAAVEKVISDELVKCGRNSMSMPRCVLNLHDALLVETGRKYSCVCSDDSARTAGHSTIPTNTGYGHGYNLVASCGIEGNSNVYKDLFEAYCDICSSACTYQSNPPMCAAECMGNVSQSLGFCETKQITMLVGQGDMGIYSYGGDMFGSRYAGMTCAAFCV